MHSLRTHPYAAALVAALVLVGTGAFIVFRTIVTPGESSTLGSLGAALLDPTSFMPIAFVPEKKEVLGEGEINAPPYIPPPTGVTTIKPQEEFDFSAFFAELSRGEMKPQKATGGTSPGSTNPYEFVPTGLIATSSALSAKRTASQQALYDWGNDTGSYIQSFESQNRTMVQVLKSHAEDRTDEAKAASLMKLAASMKELGSSIGRMDSVPAAAQGVNEKLATAYTTAGGGLERIAESSTDKGFIEAVQAYNGSAESVVRAFIAVSALFSASGVKFDAGDAGSVFLFSNARL